MTIRNYFDLFIEDQYLKGNSENTIIDYQNKLRCFLAAYGNFDIALLDLTLLNKYAKNLRDCYSNSVTIQSYVRGLRAFLNWLYLNDYVEADFCRKFRLPKARKSFINVLTDCEIRSVFGAYNDDSNLIHVRNRAIVSLMLDSGLRLNEVVSLHLSDLHLEEHYVIVNGKGNKQRAVSFGDTTYEYLRIYLSRFLSDFEFISTLFVCSDCSPITVDTIKNMFRKLKVNTGISRLHPHLLRHTFATRYLENGGSIYNLKDLLGHTTLKQTQAYLHIAQNRLQRDFKLYSPLDKIKNSP